MDGKTLTFGVSGKLYKSGLLMFDRQTDSLWSQLLQQAITGPLTGNKLTMLPAEHTPWESWRSRHPETEVLSPDTGFKRDYGLDPYAKYREAGVPVFSKQTTASSATGRKLRPMERVLGVQLDGVKKAYPFRSLKKQPPEFKDQLGDMVVVVHFDKKSETAFVTDQSGAAVPAVVLSWFAWNDFYPDSLVFNASANRSK